MRIYLQSMVEDIPDSMLPQAWVDHDFGFFSHTKRLYDYQQQALRNALKALWKYYEHFGDYQQGETDDANRQRKQQLCQWYRYNGLSEDLSIEPKSAFADLLREYYADYIDARTGKIAYEAFINRMGFWMATGSGKTLLIVKLIELLGYLRRSDSIPSCDILFLAPRDDLIQQLKRHVDEFNKSRNGMWIRLHSLQDYASIKREGSLLREQEIIVFYYRSDNLSDEQKEKIIDFRSYDNDGQWFVLLDEAHKGDREESKRQHIYSILSRNGFLFNFSATFTDPRDIATTVYNLNLSEYIRQGYGKHLLVLQQELRAFNAKEDYNKDEKHKKKKDKSEEKKDYSADEKRRLVLKTLILLAYVRKVRESIKSPLTPTLSPP